MDHEPLAAALVGQFLDLHGMHERELPAFGVDRVAAADVAEGVGERVVQPERGQELVGAEVAHIHVHRVDDLLGGIQFYGQQSGGTLFGGSITGRAAIGLTSVNLTYGAASHSFFGPITTGIWNGTAIGIAYGGTGETTRQAAMDALAGAVTSGQYLRGDGTDVVMSAIQAADVPTLNQNTTGTAANVTGIVAVANGGSGTATPSLVAGTNVTISGSWPNQTINSSGGGGGSSTITISNKTGAYTVVAGDLATVINCTSGTFTVSLTAAATLGAGFNVTIWNTSTTAADAITIDPNGAETIDGKTTLILRRGEGMQIVCDGTNWQTGDKKTMRGYAENISVGQSRPTASGDLAVAIGAGALASASAGLALGFDANTTSASGTSIGANSGSNGSRVATGAGAMALGGSYASGADSFAAAVANNTSTYGATGANSVALGNRNKASGASSSAVGGDYSVASGVLSYCFGDYCEATQTLSYAGGSQAKSDIYGKYAYASAAFAAAGDAQTGTIVLRRATTNATATVLTSNNSAPGADDQVILPNNSAYAFTGTVVARRQAAGGTESAAWKVEGLIRREANAASTTLVASTVTAISNVPLWTLALSADTTNGGLAVTATGAASTNIRWVATIQTSEVTYA